MNFGMNQQFSVFYCLQYYKKRPTAVSVFTVLVVSSSSKNLIQYTSYLPSVDTLRELHWFPIQWRIKFKLAPLTFKATHNEVPPYLARLLTPYRPSGVLGSFLLLTSCRSLALTLFSVLASSVQLLQWFGIPFLTLTVHPINLTLSGAN